MNLNQFQVPEELKPYQSWVVWGHPNSNDKGMKVPFSPITGRAASPTRYSDWGTYEQACAYAMEYGFRGIGFVLSNKDPFCLIDLDDPEGNQQIIQQQEKIFQRFPTYAEFSPSGRGLHLIIKGAIPKGRKRNKIEVYSNARYMTVTGNAYRPSPIISCQEELSKLWAAMGGTEKEQQIIDEQAPETMEDEEVYNQACAAVNGEKFLSLWEGDWGQYYGSQSEADFALIDILAFYTKSKRQIIRLFHYSALGKRPKAQRNDYLQYMLNKCFDRLLPDVDLSYLKQAIDARLQSVSVECENPKMTEESLKAGLNDVYIPPPGLLGDIARFIYEQAPRPVPEIALTGALGLMSGICGRAFNVSSTGLNQYYLLLAPTGTGKEAIASGTDKLMAAVRPTCPMAMEHMGPAQIASSPALIRHLSEGNDSFVSIMGEFGLALKEMTMPGAPSHLIGLRRILLDLYHKSGEGNVLRPTIYSNKEKNTAYIQSPAVSLLGESTPEKFYEALDESMISEGLLPRFLAIEYRGNRPALNYNHAQVKPSQELVDRLASLCGQVQALNQANKVLHVQFDAEANSLQAEFEAFCTESINKTEMDVKKHLWNRAHLKSMKIAALVAIGINPYEPIICKRSYLWAREIVVRDCINIIQRFDRGEIGVKADERQQIDKVIEMVLHFITSPWNKLSATAKSLPRADLYYDEKCIPYNFIQKRLIGTKAFKQDRLGATAAIKKTLRTLCETGDLEEVPITERKRKFGTPAACYMLANTNLIPR